MPLNLSKLSSTSLLDTETSPREIFNLLPNKHARYKYPRDVQTQVWDRWLPRRAERDLVVKMNTGGGKTVVGLLMLKSCLNEGVGPAVYVTPDNYLVSQVMKEAGDLGISVTTDTGAGAFLQGKAILVINIHKLVNGLSVFGTTDTGVKIPLGVVLVDDAHACLSSTESQFTLTASDGSATYNGLMQLFRDELLEQKASESPGVVGWLKWQLAEYVQFTDAVRAQQVLKGALLLNRRLTKPIDGLDYEKLDAKDMQQANNVVWAFKPYAGKKTDLLVRLNGVLDDLAFLPDNANEFEAAMQEVAAFLGFKAQRPELEFKRGPDVLWAVGNLRYFVIECKSGAVAQKITKHYANQLSGSMDWFGQRYDHTCKATPMMVHPYRVLEAAASGHADARVLTTGRLAALKDSIRAFCTAAASSLETLDAAKVQKLLEHHKLTAERLLETYTEAPMHG